MANDNLKEFSMEEIAPTEALSPEAVGLAATIKLDSKDLEDAVAEEVAEKGAAADGEKSLHNPVHWLPFGVTTFAEIEQFEEARDAAFEIAEKSNLFPQLVENIMADSDIDDKSAAVGRISTEFGSFVKRKMDKVADEDGDDDKAKGNAEEGASEGTSWLSRADQKIDKAVDRFVTKLSDAFNLNGKNTNIHSDKNGGLVIWKQGDQYRWLAIYSNNYRDIEAEIISAKSHERFVDMVDRGEYPMPVLRHFHVEGTDWGQAEMVHYDKETGFAIAAGYVLPGHEHEAEAVMKMDDIATSHGMPKESVKRDPADPLVYIEHQTVEISDLTFEAAANKLTNFHIIENQNKEANDMALTDEKKNYLERVGVKDVAGLEKSLANGKTLAQSLNLDSKQEGDDATAPEAVPAEAVPEVAPTEPVPVEPIETTPAQAPPAETTPIKTQPAAGTGSAAEPAAPVAPAEASPNEADSAAFSEDQTKQLTEALATVTSHILKELDAKIDTKLAPILANLTTVEKKSNDLSTTLGQTPLAGLQAAIINKELLIDQSAIMSPDTIVDQLANLAKEGGPTEAPDPDKEKKVVNSGDPFIDEIANSVVNQEFLAELKAPKAPKVPI